MCADVCILPQSSGSPLGLSVPAFPFLLLFWFHSTEASHVFCSTIFLKPSVSSLRLKTKVSFHLLFPSQHCDMWGHIFQLWRGFFMPWGALPQSHNLMHSGLLDVWWRASHSFIIICFPKSICIYAYPALQIQHYLPAEDSHMFVSNLKLANVHEVHITRCLPNPLFGFTIDALRNGHRFCLWWACASRIWLCLSTSSSLFPASILFYLLHCSAFPKCLRWPWNLQGHFLWQPSCIAFQNQSQTV